jgi:DNA-directed RNA polymerase specialized sigma24 family protein
MVTANDPTPDEAAEVAEECARLLGFLKTDDLRQVAVWKLEGYTNEEIAVKLNRSVSAVERRLQAIREIWEREGLR